MAERRQHRAAAPRAVTHAWAARMGACMDAGLVRARSLAASPVQAEGVAVRLALMSGPLRSQCNVGLARCALISKPHICCFR